MTDRYANGDTSNDRGGQTGAGEHRLRPGRLRLVPRRRLRGPHRQLHEHDHRARTVKDLGFNAVWVTPLLGQNTVQGDSAAYHGYWITDFTHVDPHFGGDADFGAFVNCAHSLGLKVIMDVVVNHTGDVIIPSGGSSFTPAATATATGRRSTRRST